MRAHRELHRLLSAGYQLIVFLSLAEAENDFCSISFLLAKATSALIFITGEGVITLRGEERRGEGGFGRRREREREKVVNATLTAGGQKPIRASESDSAA